MPVSFDYQVPGQIATAAFINFLADTVTDHDAQLEAATYGHYAGKLITVAATKATTASTTEVAVTDYGFSNLDIPAGRMVEFVARLRAQSTVAADAVMFRLRQGSVSGAIVGEERLPLIAAATPYERVLTFPWRSTGGPITWVLTAHRITGTGSVTITTGGPTLPGAFYVRDLAPDTAFTII
ncbi:hypothetical protein [Catellatospora sp. NPDC049609]|uniref:hypothetical protein n=1 Tax=Catellatospora sp. NPDC049609 TaxID=3155505 RepID=UPI0034259EC6